MNRLKKLNRLMLVLAFVSVASLSTTFGATNKKLHTSPLLIINEASINDVTDATTGISDTIDLSGGDLDVIDFQVNITSGACSSCTYDMTIQTSADGGTNWATAGTFTQITSSNSATAVTKVGTVVAPGTKARVTTALSSGTTFYTIKLWAMPRAK